MQKFLKSFEDKQKAKRKEILNPDPNKIRYGGLNIRLLANMFDLILIMLLLAPLYFIFPPDFSDIPAKIPADASELISKYQRHEISQQEFMNQLDQKGYINQIATKFFSATIINFLVFGLITILLWKKFNSSPGKMLFKLKIVDDITYEKPSISQYIVRFVGYVISALPLGLGFLIIPFNKRKKALHDYMANTVVIYAKPKNPEWEKKKNKIQLYIFFILLIFAIIYLSR